MALNVGELEAVLKVKDKMTPGIKKAQGGLKGMMGTFAKFAGAAVAVGVAIKFITSALNAQSKQIDSINKLNIALANQGNLLSGTSQSLQDYASSLQKTTKFGDEQILMLQATLAGFGMNEEQIKKTTIATLDMAEAKGIDATAAAELMGKAFVGETSMLSRYGIILDQNIPKNEKFAAALAQVNLKFGGQAQAGVATFSGKMKQLGNAFGDTMEAVGKLLGTLVQSESIFPTIIGWVESLTEFIGVDLVIAISEAKALFHDFVAAMVQGASSAVSVLGKLPDALGGAKFREAAAVMKIAAIEIHGTADAIREVGNQAATSVGKTLDVTNGIKAVTVEAGHNAVALEGLFVAYDMINEQAMPDAIAGAIAHADAMLFQATAILAATPAADGFNASLQAMVNTTDDADQVIVELDQAAGAIARTFDDGAKSVSGFEKAMAKLPGVILAAIQGGGDIGKSIGASLGGDIATSLGETLTKSLTGALGSTIAGSIGGLMGPLGALAGSAIGGLVDSLFGPGEAEKVNDMRDAFFDAQGGFVAFSESMAAVSDADWAKKIFDAKTIEEFNALVLESQGLMHMKSVADEKLQAAVDKYGFSIEELGPKWAAQELEKMAGGLLEEYELLVASGIDQGIVLDKMGEGMSDYVNTALAAGQSVPESMRKMIEAAIANGEILDENGEAFASVEEAGITFAQSMTESMMSVVESVQMLVNALLGINDIDVSPNIHIPSGGGSSIPDNRNPDFQAAAGFFSASMPVGPRAGGGTDIRVHPGEKVAVTPEGEGGGGQTTVNLTINENPMQTSETREQMRTFSVRAVADSMERNLSDLVAAGGA